MSYRVEQPDLFTPRPSTPTTKRRRRPMADSSLAALDSLGPDRATKTQRIRAAIVSSRARGLTRQELSAQLDITINAVCGIVGELLDADEIFEPVRGAASLTRDPASNRPLKKGLYLLREGRKILVAIEYLDHYPETKAERAA